MCSPLASARADVCPSICLLIRPFNHLIFTTQCGATVLQSNALQRVASRRAKPTKPTPTNHTPYRGVVGLVFWFGFARRDATREDTKPKATVPLIGVWLVRCWVCLRASCRAARISITKTDWFGVCLCNEPTYPLPMYDLVCLPTCPPTHLHTHLPTYILKPLTKSGSAPTDLTTHQPFDLHTYKPTQCICT